MLLAAQIGSVGWLFQHQGGPPQPRRILKLRPIWSQIVKTASGIDMSNRAPVEFAVSSRGGLRVLLILAVVLLAGCPRPPKPPPVTLGYGYPDAEKELDHFL
jgi:hypothetical protein